MARNDEKFNEAKEFWRTVAKPLDWGDLEVGMTLRLEDHRYSLGTRMVTITKIVKSDSGFPTLSFREATDEEVAIVGENVNVWIAG